MTTNFESLGLPEVLLRAVDAIGYTVPTPIQTQAIPVLLNGQDILGAAQTGTGKTAAFALPLMTEILQEKQPRKPGCPRALILAPTRELAAQIDENIRAYAQFTKIRTVLCFGGVGMAPQTEALSGRVDILVATPGRLLDHIGQHHVSLSDIGYLVLDEADRMLDMGFIHDIQKVLKLVPEKRQTLLFSATFNDDIKKLAKGILRNPAIVEIERNKESALVEQEAYRIAKKRKRELLRDLIVDNNWEQVLVFVRMKHSANRLAEQLTKDGIDAAAIHGNKSQSARTKALAGFKAHNVRVLVATDIAARGLDIEGLPHVVNFELPNVAEDYVHRIGRTGRAGLTGHAVSLVADDELELLRPIEKLLKKHIPLKQVKGYEGPVPEDIAEDNAKRDLARKKELEKMRLARRAQSQRRPNKPAKAAPESPVGKKSEPLKRQATPKAPVRPAKKSQAQALEKPAKRFPNPKAKTSKANPTSKNHAPKQFGKPERFESANRHTKPAKFSNAASRTRSSTVFSTQLAKSRVLTEDSRYEAVSSNLPAGIRLKISRR